MKRNWKDRVKRYLALVLTLVLLTSLVPQLDLVTTAEAAAAATQTSTTAWTELTTSHTNQWIGTNGNTTYYYVTQNTTLTATTAGYFGVGIKGTVYIYVPFGVTLNLNGAAGSGKTGGGAGILLPSGSTLYLIGSGTVNANGGKAADGTKGDDGAVGKMNVVDGTYKIAGLTKHYNSIKELSGLLDSEMIPYANILNKVEIRQSFSDDVLRRYNSITDSMNHAVNKKCKFEAMRARILYAEEALDDYRRVVEAHLITPPDLQKWKKGSDMFVLYNAQHMHPLKHRWYISPDQTNEGSGTFNTFCHRDPSLQASGDISPRCHPCQERFPGDADAAAEATGREILAVRQLISSALTDVQVFLHICNGQIVLFVHGKKSPFVLLKTKTQRRCVILHCVGEIPLANPASNRYNLPDGAGFPVV